MIAANLLEKPKNFRECLGKELPVNLLVSTDSRTIKDENAFICLYGENFDAHAMLDKIVENKNIKVIIAENKRILPEIADKLIKDYDLTFVLVEDIFQYILELGKECALAWKQGEKKIIGLTGSAGKTSSKEALFHILNSVFPNKVMATNGNLNNHIGVPLTLFRLSEEYDIAIIEMGTNSPGEIKVLAEAACPDVGLITNIGAAHLEKLIDLNGVFQEKSALYHVINEETEGGGIFILPSDDIYLNRLQDFPGVITFGKEGHYRLDLNDEGALIRKGNSSWLFDNPINEQHLLKNLVQTFILSRTMFSDYTDELFQAAKKYKPFQKNRGELVEHGKYQIYLDAYNANPLSMIVAIDTFERILKKENIDKKDALLILGDMKELGSESIRFHEELGEYLLQKKFPHIYFVGEFGKAVERRFETVTLFKTTDELAKHFENKTPEFSNILMKGSRSMALEKLLEYLPNT